MKYIYEAVFSFRTTDSKVLLNLLSNNLYIFEPLPPHSPNTQTFIWSTKLFVRTDFYDEYFCIHSECFLCIWTKMWILDKYVNFVSNIDSAFHLIIFDQKNIFFQLFKMKRLLYRTKRILIVAQYYQSMKNIMNINSFCDTSTQRARQDTIYTRDVQPFQDYGNDVIIF